MVHWPLRLRDGQTIPILNKGTAIQRWRNGPRESYFHEQNLFVLIKTQAELPPSRETGFPPLSLTQMPTSLVFSI